MTAFVTVTPEGQLAIPGEVLEGVGIRPGTLVKIEFFPPK
jgi:bifunctional DNA-binding transcriptional regulator/antitoxin component of YhaV-PrlF toxin-antitoxin module